MELDLITFLIVCPLVFLGGLVDAVAGGGGLIALPAYLIAGVPAHLALGTNKLSSAMGTVVSAFRLWRAGFLNIRKSLPAIVCSLLGSAAGAHLALLVPERVFELILVGLLPIAAFFVLSKRAVMSNDEGIITARKQLVILCISSLICGVLRARSRHLYAARFYALGKNGRAVGLWDHEGGEPREQYRSICNVCAFW